MTAPRHPNRRHVLWGLSASALMAPAAVRAFAHGPADPVFTHGVASGDPLADRVVLWTRIAPRRAPLHPVRWDVALDPGFRQVVRQGVAFAHADADWTVKVDVDRLPAGRTLHYRFSALGRQAVGRTRTLPAWHATQVRLAVFSCSNYPAGYFHAYAEAAKIDDLDTAVHLGDYIYEYGRDGYASQDAAALGRLSQPAVELLTLSDYRRRYAQYRSDPDLQALHARVPFIAVWDDHEIANDTWREGAENHDPTREGPFAARKAAALRAYHEWMPTRLPDPTRPDRLYRSFTFGRLVDLHMLDTRLVGRDRPLSYASYLGATGFDAARFAADLSDPARQLLGAQQTEWLARRLAATRARWTVLGQQVLMGRMDVPAPLVLGQIGFGAYAALLAKAQTAPQTLTPQELAILAQPAIPYNLDAWDGYAAAREAVLGLARANDKNLVVLAGDTHNAWASNLLDAAGHPIGVEFATPAVSSPGLEAYFPAENPLAVAAGLQQIIGPLVYANTKDGGFMLVTATAEECRAEWRFVSTVKSKVYDAYTGRVLRTLPGAGQRHLVEA
ncbi:alkaline phosphatase D family protein [Calidifontimicrobium sp. SYSU G02091]|uniref:alkaline phosphatase D family protein n=1 Tax=Calidifontimicrobium sp. SYSU G02091 TaxID=2926421 RepID=UPI001F536A04|nr:alkaline phosphatase D family protein [Calidifontimicrobium sp. SYSU G02091]MCI1191153.1 alkaline phosphatase D family protein [Calidifontimicrobium sp. SYSU G02091]